MEDIKRVISFDSVEEFWGLRVPAKGLMGNQLTLLFNSLYNNIVPPSQLPQKANYYLFKVRGSASAIDDGRITTFNRMGSFPLGRMRQIKLVENGVFNFPRRRIEAMSIKCGSIL